MARIRSIHPGLFTDEAFMSASAHARLLIIGIWTEAWDDGVFEWKPLTLKAKLFPVDNVDMAGLLDELVSLDFVKPFEAGKKYGAIRNFQKYQKPKKPNSSGVLPKCLHEYVRAVPNQLPTGGEKSPQMEDGIGGGRGNGEIKIKSNSGKPAPEFRPFPPDGTISFTEPYSTIARNRGRGADPDVLASAFRQFCHGNGIDFGDPRIATKFETFCGKHKVAGLHS